MNEINNILGERGEVYGDFTKGNKVRCDLITIIGEAYHDHHGHEMPLEDLMAIYDVVIKLTRIAISPHHIDSWADIVGYSLLNINRIKENQNADQR